MFEMTLLFLFMLGVVMYSVLTYRLMKEHCPVCDKPSRCNTNWGFIYSKPLTKRCVHCNAELE